MKNEKIFFLNSMPMGERGGLTPGRIRSISRESVKQGFRHTLIGTGFERLDAWAVAQLALGSEPAFSPLVAVNSAEEHPVATARKLATLARFHPEARLAFNAVAGSFGRELRSAGESLSPAARLARAGEHARITCELLLPPARSDFTGKFFRTRGLSIQPPWPHAGLDVFLSGSSSEELSPLPGLNVFRVRNLRPLEAQPAAPGPRNGLRLGVHARATTEEAVSSLEQVFPPNREAELRFSLSAHVEASAWGAFLSERLRDFPPANPHYCLLPISRGASSAPYLVGSHEVVAGRLLAYTRLGYEFFLLDEAASEEEYGHLGRVIELTGRG